MKNNKSKNIFKIDNKIKIKNNGWLTDEFKKSKFFFESQEKISLIISKFSEDFKKSWSNEEK